MNKLNTNIIASIAKMLNIYQENKMPWLQNLLLVS